MEKISRIDKSSLGLRYRIHWNWKISQACNYRCSYCPEWKKDIETSRVDIEKWIRVWDGIFYKYGCCHIRFSGGEPTVHPFFFELLNNLLKKHTIDITTNLSFDLRYFFKKIDPGRISISASFHPEYALIEEFTDKVYLLWKKGYLSTLTCVAYPPFLDKLADYKKVAEKKGLIFKISSFSGDYKGVKYPRGYNDKQRLLLKNLSEDTENLEQRNINTRWVKHKIEDNENKLPPHKVCRMGQMYAVIHSDGMVTRCCAEGGPCLGNILNENIRLFDKSRPCTVEHCPCFKAMLVGYEEEKWMPLWNTSIYDQSG